MRINAYILTKLLLHLAASSSDEPEVIVKKFLDFCRLHNIEYLLGRVLVLLRIEERRLKEHQQAYVYTAYPLSSKLRDKLVELVGIDKNVKFIVKEDKDLLGGVVVKYNNKIYDASLRSQLARMVRYLGN